MNPGEIKLKVFRISQMKLLLNLFRNISKNMKKIKMNKEMEIQDGF